MRFLRNRLYITTFYFGVDILYEFQTAHNFICEICVG
nr:MAG TPA: hypothetical protein [Caudoviricetes sp.]